MSAFVSISVGGNLDIDTCADILNLINGVSEANPRKVIKVDCSKVIKLDRHGVRALVMNKHVIPINLREDHARIYDKEKRNYVKFNTQTNFKYEPILV